MEKKYTTDTVAAIATPAGEGGIAVIRISGSNAAEIGSKILSCSGGFTDRTAKICGLDTGKVKDKVIALYFKGPRSFTGEDVLEIHCHGNYFLAQRITQALIEHGCRAAEPGEFTRRAFLNGRIDLTKAEGILDLIRAKSESAAAAAYAAVSGGLENSVGALVKELTGLIAAAAAAVDYPEEDLTEPAKEDVLAGAGQIAKQLAALKNSYAGAALIKEGVRVAITGEPNVGKSLLLNRLTGKDRSIVTDEAGTTRDTVEESFLYKGVRFNLIDTAGVRAAESAAERLGVERSRRAVLEADLVLAVAEAGKEFGVALPAEKPVIFVKNKLDLYGKQKAAAGTELFISAKTGENIEHLKEEMYQKTVGKISGAGVSINNLRQLAAVERALGALNRAEEAKNLSLDCILSDLNDACRALGEITGVTASDEVVNEIFSKFCVGK